MPAILQPTQSDSESAPPLSDRLSISPAPSFDAVKGLPLCNQSGFFRPHSFNAPQKKMFHMKRPGAPTLCQRPALDVAVSRVTFFTSARHKFGMWRRSFLLLILIPLLRYVDLNGRSKRSIRYVTRAKVHGTSCEWEGVPRRISTTAKSSVACESSSV